MVLLELPVVTILVVADSSSSSGQKLLVRGYRYLPFHISPFDAN